MAWIPEFIKVAASLTISEAEFNVDSTAEGKTHLLQLSKLSESLEHLCFPRKESVSQP